MPEHSYPHHLCPNAKPCTISSSALVDLGSLIHDSEDPDYRKTLTSVQFQSYFKMGLSFTFKMRYIKKIKLDTQLTSVSFPKKLA
jgi:hypothetical protein